jgi:hypothetical protein
MEESNWPGRVGSIGCLQHSLYPSPQTDYGGGAPLLRTPTVSPERSMEKQDRSWSTLSFVSSLLSTFARCMTWRRVATVLFQMRTLWCRAPSTVLYCQPRRRMLAWGKEARQKQVVAPDRADQSSSSPRAAEALSPPLPTSNSKTWNTVKTSSIETTWSTRPQMESSAWGWALEEDPLIGGGKGVAQTGDFQARTL